LSGPSTRVSRKRELLVQGRGVQVGSLCCPCQPGGSHALGVRMPAQSAEGASCSHLPRRVSQGRPAEACLFLELAGAPGTLLGGDCSPAQGQASQPRQGFLALGAQCCGVALQGPVTQLEPRRWPRQRLARTHRRPGWACEQGRVGPLGGILVGSRSLLLQGCSADAWHGLPVCLAWARRHQGGIGRAFSSALHVYVTCYLPCTNTTCRLARCAFSVGTWECRLCGNKRRSCSAFALVWSLAR